MIGKWQVAKGALLSSRFWVCLYALAEATDLCDTTDNFSQESENTRTISIFNKHYTYSNKSVEVYLLQIWQPAFNVIVSSIWQHRTHGGRAVAL